MSDDRPFIAPPPTNQANAPSPPPLPSSPPSVPRPVEPLEYRRVVRVSYARWLRDADILLAAFVFWVVLFFMFAALVFLIAGAA